jgi:hypothetical protein
MKIEPKYEIGQDVWVRTYDFSLFSKIKAIKAIYDRFDEVVMRIYDYQYYVDCLGWVEEDELFSTKEELLLCFTRIKD